MSAFARLGRVIGALALVTVAFAGIHSVTHDSDGNAPAQAGFGWDSPAPVPPAN
ncbi:hypothetical protein ACIBF5_18175 [Micromonospora sp. NPDC050417]|uniref:hypothetical protein n=1 Tax=Micromonospora sp. NPDC050417 TaxID=3364280 RepID=UPI0037BD53BA